MPVGIVSQPHAIKLGRVEETMSGFPYCEVLIFNDRKLHWSFGTQRRTSVWDLRTNLPSGFVGEQLFRVAIWVSSHSVWFHSPASGLRETQV